MHCTTVSAMDKSFLVIRKQHSSRPMNRAQEAPRLEGYLPT